MTSPTTSVGVLDQGFPCKVAWWRRYITEDQWWPSALNKLPPDPARPAYQRVTRRDVFGLARDPSPVGRVGLLLAVYIWGTGESGFLVGRRARVFKASLNLVGERLVAAVAVMERDGAVAAYDLLLARQPLHVMFLGPAFFTKFLYFAAAEQSPFVGPQPLILDRFVARALIDRGLSLPRSGWASADYGRYLTYAAEVAQQADTTPDAVELTLFNATARAGT